MRFEQHHQTCCVLLIGWGLLLWCAIVAMVVIGDATALVFALPGSAVAIVMAASIHRFERARRSGLARQLRGVLRDLKL